MATKTDRVLRQLRSRPQSRTPIATDMFIPNQSGTQKFTKTTYGVNSLPYASMKATDNTTETVISEAGVSYQITIFNSNGSYYKNTPDHTNDHILIDTEGTYLITCSATVNSVAGANSRFEFIVKKNNGATNVDGLHCDRNLNGGATSSGVISVTGISKLSVGDTIEAWIENETNTQNYVIENITLSLVRIGE